jgi:hypothetical protein
MTTINGSSRIRLVTQTLRGDEARVTADRNGEPTTTLPLVRKIGWTVLTGFIAFSGSALLDNVLHVSLADQMLLTVITGGVTLIVQYLSEFEQKITTFEGYQRHILSELDAAIQRGFAGVNEATELREEIEKSSLDSEALKQAIRRAGRFTSRTGPLVRQLANSEVERVSGTLQSLAGGHELFYEGEDREYLLALTRHARESIMATSWTATSGLEAGFWFTDLAARYLDLQRAAIRRGVEIKRVFIFETPDLMDSVDVKRTLAVQHNLGVEIRLFGVGPVPPDGSIADFVLFDSAVSHETVPVTRREGSGALITRLVLAPDVVHNRMLRFQELWDAADPHPMPAVDRSKTASELLEESTAVPTRSLASGLP